MTAPGASAGGPLAVVGLSCRLPGVDTPDQLWDLLCRKRSTIAERVEARWPGDLSDAAPLPAASVLPDADRFDSQAYGLSPREAAEVDPHHRLTLELGTSALESTGDGSGLLGSATGVYLGLASHDWAALRAADQVSAPGTPCSTFAFTASQHSLAANRLSHLWGLTGPSLVVDGGQSSSLLAVHLAARALRSGEVDVALAGGVHLLLSGAGTVAAAAAGLLSPDGEPRVLDRSANGFVRGEGGAMVVLRRLDDALRDGARIHAVILGSASATGVSGTLVEPDSAAQAQVLSAALRDAGVDVRELGFTELHGTGTPRGDRAEAHALRTVLAGSGRSQPLAVASIKTNVGHLEAAAGVLGLLRAVLTVREARLTASPGHVAPPDDLPLARWGLRVQTEAGPWPSAGRRVASVGSIGLGGSVTHVVVAEPAGTAGVRAAGRQAGQGTDGDSPGAAGVDVRGLPLSASSPAALSQVADQLLGCGAVEAGGQDPARFADLASTLARRVPRRYRAVLLGQGPQRAGGFAVALRDLRDGRPSAGVLAARASGPAFGARSDPPAGLAFVFPGQGSQWAGMAADLLHTEPAFAAALAEVDHAVSRHTGWSVTERLTAGEPLPGEDVVQPALFATMVALARWWESVGVRPDVVIGHSQGELAAACVAGALTLEDGARIVVARSRAVGSLPPGHGMLAVRLPADAAERLCAEAGGCVVAVVNAAESCVLAGPLAALERAVRTADRRGVRSRWVEVGYASHSPQVEPLRAGLLEAFGPVATTASSVRFASSVTGGFLDAGQLDGCYWWRNLRCPVRFADALTATLAAGVRHVVEISPHPSLVSDVEEGARSLGEPVQVVGSLTRDGGRSDLFANAAQLWCAGAAVDWHRLQPLDRRRLVDLPPHPDRRRRVWPTCPDDGGGVAHPHVRGSLTPQQLVVDALRAVLGHDGDVDPDATFESLGLDSRGAVAVRDQLARVTGRPLPVGLVYAHPTPGRLGRWLTTELQDEVQGGVQDEPGDDQRGALGAESSIERPRRARTTEPAHEVDPVAVVAMAGRFPGAGDLRELWSLLSEGREGIGPLPADRAWRDRLEQARLGGQTIPQRGGFLSTATEFDARYFGIGPREALAMDPQQRVLLEVCREALDGWGIELASGTGTCGVYVGAMPGSYGPRLGDGEGADGTAGYVLTGTTPSVLAARLSYTLGLQGPALTVDTACSSSLVALHLARRALQAGDADRCIVGGTCVMADPGIFMEFAQQRGLAADGRCKAFSAAADGTVWAEGVAVLVLERLSVARAAGHRVLGVVRGSAVNQDGATNGITAPSGPAQVRVVRAALADAGLTGDDVDAVEAHGTGTRLGDPVEAAALAQVYGTERPAGRPLRLGSMKSNLGHMQAAAGIGGVIKMLLALQHELLPATLHATTPSPHLDWAGSGLRLLTESHPWPRGQGVRRGGVSSFGIGGTNAHVVIEEPPVAEPGAATAPIPFGHPTRPWRRTRFWWEPAGRESDRARTPSRLLVDDVITMPDGGIVATGTVDLARQTWLRDHRVGDRVVVPGTALLDAVVGASRTLGEFQVESLTFVAPLVAGPAARELRVLVGAPEDDARRPVSVSASTSTGFELVARGWLALPRPRGSDPDQTALGEPDVGRDAPQAQRLPQGEVQDRLATVGLEYGPQFRVLTRTVLVGSGPGARASSSCPVEAGPPAGCVLDPRHLDGAFQLAVRLLVDDVPPGRTVLPAGLRDVWVRAADPPAPDRPAAAPARVEAVVLDRSDRGATARVALGDEGGPLLTGTVELRFVEPGGVGKGEVRSVPAGAPAGRPVLLAPVELPVEVRPSVAAQRIAVLGDDELRLRTILRGVADVVAVPTLDALDRAWSQGLVVDRVVVGVRRSDPSAGDLEVERALGLVQAWVSDPRARRTPLRVVTVAGPDRRWWDDAVEALLVSARLERAGDVGVLRWHPAWPSDPEQQDAQDAAALLPAALADPRRLVVTATSITRPGLRRRSAEPLSPTGLDPERAVLITGGLGSVGRRLALHLAHRHGIRYLVTASRRGPGDPHATELRAQLADVGARLDVRTVDVTSGVDVAHLVRDLGRRGLGAVFHLGGTIEDRTVARTTTAALGRTLAAKVGGALQLDQATRGLGLTDFVLFSSVAGVLGSAGQGAYAAANAAMRHIALERRAAGEPGQVLAWGPWSAGDGMADALAAADVARWRRRGVGALAPDDALDLLDAALACRAPELVPVALLDDAPDADDQLAAGPAAGSGAEPPSCAPPSSRPDVAGQVLAAVRHVLQVPAGELSAGAVLWDLGLDSLTAMELVDRLRAEPGVVLASTDVFETTSVGDLCALVQARCGAIPAADATSPVAGPDVTA